jgi:hypothetical protein
MMSTYDPQEGQERPGRKTGSLEKTLKTEASSAARALGDARDAAMDKASDLASEAKEAAMQRGGDLQKNISASLKTYAEAVEKACEQLDNNSDATAARLVREAANGLRKCSDSLASMGRLSRSSERNMVASTKEVSGAGSAGPARAEPRAFDRAFESGGTS